MFNTKQSKSEISKQTRIMEPTTALILRAVQEIKHCFKTNKEYESLVPPMTKEAFESLLSSIREKSGPLYLLCRLEIARLGAAKLITRYPVSGGTIYSRLPQEFTSPRQ